MSIYQLGERVPVIDPTAFVYENATLIGLVILRARVDVWPYATIRADNEPIEIGENSNVQAVILDGAKIGRNCLIGAGALVTEGREIPDNSLVLRSPGKVVRTPNEADIAGIHSNTANYVRRGQRYKEALRRIA